KLIFNTFLLSAKRVERPITSSESLRTEKMVNGRLSSNFPYDPAKDIFKMNSTKVPATMPAIMPTNAPSTYGNAYVCGIVPSGESSQTGTNTITHTSNPTIKNGIHVTFPILF